MNPGAVLVMGGIGLVVFGLVTHRRTLAFIGGCMVAANLVLSARPNR